jgi:starch synthase
VRRVGGLADTVVDADAAALAADRATGFVFDAATPKAFELAVLHALAARREPLTWQRLMARAMAQPLQWAGPAREYLALYAEALRERLRPPDDGLPG